MFYDFAAEQLAASETTSDLELPIAVLMLRTVAAKQLERAGMAKAAVRKMLMGGGQVSEAERTRDHGWISTWEASTKDGIVIRQTPEKVAA